MRVLITIHDTGEYVTGKQYFLKARINKYTLRAMDISTDFVKWLKKNHSTQDGLACELGVSQAIVQRAIKWLETGKTQRLKAQPLALPRAIKLEELSTGMWPRQLWGHAPLIGEDFGKKINSDKARRVIAQRSIDAMKLELGDHS